ncbi:MAG: 4Fe-4S dicluster domain-containing protein [Actinobacteria bacterium]|nr:MAG: 4Fe-4S dicluster domain-containing protein [Actinomycetota bacterium]
MISYIPEQFKVNFSDKCIKCLACVKQCSFGALSYDEEDNTIYSTDKNCVACHRCVTLCPTKAISITKNPLAYRHNNYWKPETVENIYKQAETGGILLTGSGNDQEWPSYFDRLLFDASQVTNPSIDPIREPMELRTYLGEKPSELKVTRKDGKLVISTKYKPQVKLETPIMFGAMSLGAVSLNLHRGLARASKEAGTLWNTGEGGLHEELYEFGDNTTVQVASGRYGVNHRYLNAGRVVEIKIGQGAKPGIGGHLPGEKINEDISRTRMIPKGTDALSPAPHHDIYSIEDLAQLVYALKEATHYKKLVSVKIAAVHNVAAIASGIARAGADIVTIDGFRGGTGATPTIIRNHIGIPIELAIAAVDDRLRREGIRNTVSLVASGGIRNSADVAKAIALGADAVYIGTAALLSVGCTLCQKCYTGKCAWGITTTNPELVKRLNPEIAYRRLYNLLRGWSIEIKEMIGAMGLNAIESLRGNRLKLRGVGLSDTELEILGVKPAGR